MHLSSILFRKNKARLGWPRLLTRGAALQLFRSAATLLLVASAHALDPAGSARFVAVGYGGRITFSNDGAQWETVVHWSQPTRGESLADITWGMGKYIAVGGDEDTGQIISSGDGRKWTSCDVLSSKVGTITFGRSRFVAAQGNQLLYSIDGLHFVPGAKLPMEGTTAPLGAACGDTEAGYLFVFVGESEKPAQADPTFWRACTTDGITLTSIQEETPRVRSIAYGAGRFVVVGPSGLIEESHDGQKWRRCPVNPAEDFRSVVWAENRFLVSGKMIWTSPDGLSWERLPSSIPCEIATASPFGSVGISRSGDLFFSKDFLLWQRVALATGPPFAAATCSLVP